MTRLLVGPVLRHVGTTDATIWVETDGPCEVRVLGARERTWTASGHHYALVTVDGLEPGTATEYEVHLDDEPVWPPPDASRPPSRIRTLPPADSDAAGRVRIAFGSCRYSRSAVTASDPHFAPDSLAAYARELAREDEADWPTALLMLGDQVYADETTEPTRRRIRAKRDITTGSKDQVADFEEYTWLYLESWTDPDVRWLMSTIPSSMIFDDHDVRDDWNTSHVLAAGDAGAPTGGRNASSAACRRTGCTSTSATCRPPTSPPTSCTSRYVSTTATSSPCCGNSQCTPTPRPTAPRAPAGRTAATSAAPGC